MSWTIYVPVFITIAGKRWSLGEFACFYVGSYYYSIICMHTFILCLSYLIKVSKLLYNFNTMNINRFETPRFSESVKHLSET